MDSTKQLSGPPPVTSLLSKESHHPLDDGEIEWPTRKKADYDDDDIDTDDEESKNLSSPSTPSSGTPLTTQETTKEVTKHSEVEDPEPDDNSELTLELADRSAKIEKELETMFTRVGGLENDLNETKKKANDFGQRMMSWKEEQAAVNQQQQQVVATCIKQIVGLTSQLGGIVQPGFLDTIAEQLSKTFVTELAQLRKDLTTAQQRIEDLQQALETKERKEIISLRLQIDQLRMKIDRLKPSRPKVSRIPRLKARSKPEEISPQSSPAKLEIKTEVKTSTPPLPAPSPKPLTPVTPKAGVPPAIPGHFRARSYSEIGTKHPMQLARSGTTLPTNGLSGLSSSSSYFGRPARKSISGLPLKPKTSK